MSQNPTKTPNSSVTVARNGARSVNLSQVLNTSRAKEQLREIKKIAASHATEDRGRGKE